MLWIRLLEWLTWYQKKKKIQRKLCERVRGSIWIGNNAVHSVNFFFASACWNKKLNKSSARKKAKHFQRLINVKINAIVNFHNEFFSLSLSQSFKCDDAPNILCCLCGILRCMFTQFKTVCSVRANCIKQRQSHFAIFFFCVMSANFRLANGSQG